MNPIRIVRATPCVLGVLLIVLIGRPLAARGADEMAVDRALRKVLRTNLPLAERLEAATLALEDPASGDGETLARAGIALLPDASRVGAWLLLVGTDAAWLDESLRARGRARVDGLLGEDAPSADRAAWTAAGVLLGSRPEGFEQTLVAAWPPDDATAAVLRREGVDPTGTAGATRSKLEQRAPAARALEEATSAEVDRMRAGLDALPCLFGGFDAAYRHLG